MDIYEMMKRGMTPEEIQAMFAAECTIAQARVEHDKEEAAKLAQAEERKAEARAHLINAALAYAEAFGFLTEEPTQEDVEEMEAFFIEAEKDLGAMLEMFKAATQVKEDKPKAKRGARPKIMVEGIDADRFEDAMRSFFEGLM